MADQGKRRRRLDRGGPALDARRLIQRLSGARLCFGKPVYAGTRTVVPVASVRTAGGLGFGRSWAPDADDSPDAEHEQTGGGGGGVLDARPVGFIDIGPEGARFRPIPARRPLGLVTRTVLAGLGAWAAGRVVRAGPPASLRAISPPAVARRAVARRAVARRAVARRAVARRAVARRVTRPKRPRAAALPWPRR